MASVLADGRRATLVAAFAFVWIFPAKSFASQVQRGTLKRAAEVAFAVFAGTVDSTRTEMIDGHVVTHVHLSRLKFAKGPPGGQTFTLHMAGGDYNGRRYWTVGQPEFQVRRRYVLFVEKDPGSRENLYLPILGLYQGFYPILPDSATGRLVVHDWQDRPVAAISQGHIVSVDEARRTPSRTGDPVDRSPSREEPPFEVVTADDDPGTRMAESEFLDTIRRFSRNSDPK